MKIVHINFSDSIGGAAIAVKRTHELLLREGIDSHLLVIENKENLSNTYSVDNTLFATFKIKINKISDNVFRQPFPTTCPNNICRS